MSLDQVNSIQYNECYGFTRLVQILGEQPFSIVPIDNRRLWGFGNDNKPAANRTWAEIKRWLLSRSTGVIAHEFVQLDIEKHRFYFSDAALAGEFRQALPELMKKTGWFFNSISEHPMEMGHGMKVSALLKYTLPGSYSGLAFDIWCWCEEHLKARLWFIPKSSMILFESEDDYVLFKLKFIGAENEV